MNWTKLIFLLGAGALASIPAQASLTYSIQPSSQTAVPGDVGDSFDVVITNTGGTGVSIAAFSFEITVSSPDVSLDSANFSTALTYIFSGDSFDQLNAFALNTTSGQTLDALDLTNSGADVTLGAGASLGLGHVLFSVSPSATIGEVLTLAFTGGDAQNNVSNAAGNLTTISTFNSGSIQVVPEPSAAVALLAGLAWLYARRRRT